MIIVFLSRAVWTGTALALGTITLSDKFLIQNHWLPLRYPYKIFCNRYKDSGSDRNKFSYEDIHESNNNGLEYIVAFLEEVYNDPKFPPNSDTLKNSLRSMGKSRADLWAFAAKAQWFIFLIRWTYFLLLQDCKMGYVNGLMGWNPSHYHPFLAWTPPLPSHIHLITCDF